ncbi:MAG: membrane protein insertion efficiency factor YidD [Alphaproteobacteria bacterium]|nr:membrane protein insertion efficiency factor YidD [Alphaproteobacteria bacterium]
MMSHLLRLLIRSYQIFVSPFFGPSCRFQPTCSRYAIEAITSHGAWRGFFLTLKRLSHCHPFSKKCGYDPVPVVQQNPSLSKDYL